MFSKVASSSSRFRSFSVVTSGEVSDNVEVESGSENVTNAFTKFEPFSVTVAVTLPLNP